MSPAELLETSESIRQRVVGQQRVSVTELARGTAWRKQLADCKLLEVVDRNTTAGWLVSEEGMAALLDTISYFESEAERAQIAYLIETRRDETSWKSGTDLQEAVDRNAESSIERLKAALNGD